MVDRSKFSIPIVFLLSCAIPAWCQTLPDLFNVQPNVSPWVGVPDLKRDPLATMRLVAVESTLAYGDSVLGESYRPHDGRGDPRYYVLKSEAKVFVKKANYGGER